MKTSIKRNKSQFIGTSGESLVQHIMDSNQLWISRKLPNDFGIDFELELCNHEVAGQFIKVQVKSAQQLKVLSRVIIGRVTKKLLNYSYECRLPVILVLVDLTEKSAYYCWLQEWIERYFPNKEFNQQSASSFKIEIPITQTLESGLQSELITIARGMTKTQLLFNLRETIKISMLDNTNSITERLTQILIDISHDHKFFTLETIIEEVLKLGHRIWATDEGNKASWILYSICREFGHQVTVKHIDKIILREDNISRVGLNALGILYDKHFNHIQSLNLPKHFKETEGVTLEYYCRLREKYPTLSDMQFTNEKLDTSIDGIDIDIRKSDRLFDKLINRGTSALFDYMIMPSKESAK